MVNTIEIKVECKGSAAGTLGWLNSILEGSELVIRNTKSGGPGMFLRLNLDEYKNGCSRSMFICKKVVTLADCEGYLYKSMDDLIIYVNPVGDPYGYEVGLFNLPLTPACTRKVEELIDSAVKQYREWWEKN